MAPVTEATSYDEHEDRKPENLRGLTAVHAPAVAPGTGLSDFMHFDASDSVPRLHTDSSNSEHVVSPEFTCEVQSERKSEWNKMFDFGDCGSSCYVDDVDFGSAHMAGINQMSPLQDMFMYLQKPF